MGGNVLLTLMVTSSLILVFMCLAGLTFAVFRIDFGPVESLGVSIFVGLSANYLLHAAHSYHRSFIADRKVKIQRAIFVVGSPIIWSALSTICGSAFLFACRTWLLTELGILITTIIALSLTFSLGFLLALLAWVGPLPLSRPSDDTPRLHTWDLMAIFYTCSNCLREDDQPKDLPAEDTHDSEDDSCSAEENHSIGVVKMKGSCVHEKNPKGGTTPSSENQPFQNMGSF